MPPRSYQSLLGVLFGFLCVFPLLMKRDKKMPLNTSEVLLQQAQAQTREAQAKNRARAVEAITQKNHLQALADQTQKRVDQLTGRLEALDAGENEARQSLLTQRDHHQKALSEMQEPLAFAIATAEAVKIAMRQEEERIRAMTAEALALKATEKPGKNRNRACQKPSRADNKPCNGFVCAGPRENPSDQSPARFSDEDC